MSLERIREEMHGMEQRAKRAEALNKESAAAQASRWIGGRCRRRLAAYIDGLLLAVVPT